MISKLNTASVQNIEVNPNATVVPFGNGDASPSVSDETKKIQEVHARQAEQERKAEQEEQKEEQITQEDLDELSKSIDMVHSVGLKFSMHNDTGRTMITVTNRDTEEIIREIPSKEVLDMVAKMEEMVGILFDLKA